MVGPVKYAIVGLGRAGWAIHAEILKSRPDARIVAVADPSAARREEAACAFQCRTHRTLPSLLRLEPDVDVVVVATPSKRHGPDTKAALKAGKHVVVEKPMAMSVAEADAMIRCAQDVDRLLFVHQNYRFFPVYGHFQRLVDGGRIGRLFHIRYCSTQFVRRNDWQTLSVNGGGVLNNTGPHVLDYLIQLAGAPIEQVLGDLQQIASPGDVEDHVKAFMRASNGCTIDIEISSAQNIAGDQARWVLSGTHGTLTSDEATSVIRWFDPAAVAPLEVIDGPAPDRAYGNDDQLPWQETTVEVATDAAESPSFYDNVTAVLHEGAPMVVTPQSAREVIRVIAMIRKGTPFARRRMRCIENQSPTTGSRTRGSGIPGRTWS